MTAVQPAETDARRGVHAGSESIAPSSPVQPREIRRHEHSVLSDHLAVEADGAAAVVGALDADEVPVDLAVVAVADRSFGPLHGKCQSVPVTAWHMPCKLPRLCGGIQTRDWNCVCSQKRKHSLLT